jgi:phage-related protein
MADGVGVGFTDNMDGVEGDMTAAMGGAGELTAAEAVKSVNDGIIANIEGLSGAVNAIVERVITGLTAQAQQLNQAGQDFDKNIASGMITATPQITQKIPQIVQSTITAFVAQHPKFVTEGTDIDKNIAQGMISGIPQITEKVAQIVQPVITALRSYVSDFTSAGEEMVKGIWQGFQNMKSWLESKVRSMMKEIVAAVKDEMDINSPSKVFAGIGAYMAQGLGEGFAHEMRDVESTIRRETSNAVPEVSSGEGQQKRGSNTPSVEVVQNIYAENTSYAEQQRLAARQFRQIAREVMA